MRRSLVTSISPVQENSGQSKYKRLNAANRVGRGNCIHAPNSMKKSDVQSHISTTTTKLDPCKK